MITLVMCVGNSDNGDDGVGPYVSKIFPKTDDFKVVNCETVPENFTHLIKNVDRVVLVDAVEMGLTPGETRVVPREKIGGLHVSTHSLPLSVLMDYVREEGKEVVLVGVQPKKLHGGLSVEVKKAAEKLVETLINYDVDGFKVFE